MSGGSFGTGGGGGGAASIAAGDITDVGATGEALVQAETAAEARATLGVSGDPGLPTSGLVALWRASDLALSDGDPVSTWAPGSGTPGSLTGSGSARPTYRATGSPSGGPAVEFDGSDDELSLSSPAGLPSGAAAGTLVAIVSRAFHNGSISLIVQYGAGATAQCRGLGLNATQWYLYDYAADLSVGAAADGTRHRRGVVLVHRYTGSARELWVDGVPVASDARALNTGTSVLHVGRSVYGGERAAFRLMALAIYSSALSDAALAQIQTHARLAHGVA